MKTTKLFLGILLCCTLFSCGGSGNRPEEPTQEEQNEMKEKALELATFLTDNYSVGDSVFFTTETGEKEGFVVSQNRFEELNEIIEGEGEEPEEDDINDEGEEPFSVVAAGYKMVTKLQNTSNTILIELFYMSENGKAYTDGAIVLNNKWSTERSYVTVNDETVTIRQSDRSCTMQKNIGIISIFVNKHYWNLIQ